MFNWIKTILEKNTYYKVPLEKKNTFHPLTTERNHLFCAHSKLVPNVIGFEKGFERVNDDY